MLLGRLSLLDIDEIGQIADLTEAEARALGPRGLELVMRARGIDTSPVDPEPVEQKTVRSTIVFEPDTSDPEIIKIRLRSLVGELGLLSESECRYTQSIHGDLVHRWANYSCNG